MPMDRFGQQANAWGSGQTKQEPSESVQRPQRKTTATTTTSTTTTTIKPVIPKDRFGQQANAWGSDQTKKESPESTRRPQRPSKIDERVSTGERREENVRRTTRKSRPAKIRRTKRPNLQLGVGSNDFALVDTGGAKVDLNKVITSPTTTTPRPRRTATDRFGQLVQAWGNDQTRQEPSDSVERPAKVNPDKAITTRRTNIPDRTTNAEAWNWGQQSSTSSSARPNVEQKNVDSKPNWGWCHHCPFEDFIKTTNKYIISYKRLLHC